jgi:hypothetical protein
VVVPVIELVLGLAASHSLTLCVGHILGAWPGHVVEQRDARTVERDAAATQAGQMQRQLWDAEEELGRERIARQDAESKYFAIVTRDIGGPE